MTFTARLGDRSLFPTLEPRVYLNHGAISPASTPVIAAVNAYLQDYARRGVAAFPTWQAQRRGLKEKLARLIHARPEDLAFEPNTTRGITDVALCFPWRANDRVVLFEGEFPANVTPWQRAAARFGLRLVFQPVSQFARDEARALTLLEEELKRGVRLVAVSAVQFQTGLKMPLLELARLCHAHGAELFVDGVQAIGAVPLDVTALEIDYLACGSHKWLMGLEGAGFLYVRPGRAAALIPSVAGWTSHEDGLGFLSEGPGHLRYDRPVRPLANLVEGGNLNSAGLAALDASVELLLQLGPNSISEHVNRLLAPFEAGLVARGFLSLRSAKPSQRSCTLAVLPPGGRSVVTLQRLLSERGISCSIPDGVLRFTPHWPNSEAEVPLVLEAIDAALPSA